jgi:hypothetical protein
VYSIQRVQSNSLLCNGSSEMVRMEKKPPSWRNTFQQYSINRWAPLGPYPKRQIRRWPTALVLVTWVGGTFIFHRTILIVFRKFGEPSSLLSTSRLPQFMEDVMSSISMYVVLSFTNTILIRSTFLCNLHFSSFKTFKITSCATAM